MMNRRQLIKKLKEEFPNMWMKLGEEFDRNYKKAIWTGEGSEDAEGMPLFDRYVSCVDPYEKVYTMGVRNTLRAILDDAGWYAEWHDSGTVFLFPC